jgi:hypothetical protein
MTNRKRKPDVSGQEKLELAKQIAQQSHGSLRRTRPSNVLSCVF